MFSPRKLFLLKKIKIVFFFTPPAQERNIASISAYQYLDLSGQVSKGKHAIFFIFCSIPFLEQILSEKLLRMFVLKTFYNFLNWLFAVWWICLVQVFQLVQIFPVVWCFLARINLDFLFWKLIICCASMHAGCSQANYKLFRN